MQPSDMRLKKDCVLTDTRQQLLNIEKIRLYSYNLTDDWAEQSGHGTRAQCGVLAQELQTVLPDAVVRTGDLELGPRVVKDLLVVDKERVFMETVGAVQELSRTTVSGGFGDSNN